MNRIPEYIERLLSLRVYREAGIVALLALIIPAAVGIWILGNSTDGADASKRSALFTVDPYYVKTNHAHFAEFLNDIKERDGALILGTSETGSLHGKNYFQFLNSDPEVEREFSMLGGAGRFADVYIPLIAANPEAWSGLEVLLYVNPTYWRENLNYFRKDYFTRYLDPRIAAAHKADLQELGIWESLYQDYFLSQPPLKVAGMQLDLSVEQIRGLFFRDLRQRFESEENPFSDFPEPLDLAAIDESELLEDLDLELNVSKAYKAKTKTLELPSVKKDSDYRTQAIIGMIKICKKHGVKLRIALGSYNAVLGTNGGNAEAIPDYEVVINQLRSIFVTENVPYVDLSDLSSVKGTYIDAQHHSSYGAWLKYQRIKAHYAKD